MDKVDSAIMEAVHEGGRYAMQSWSRQSAKVVSAFAILGSLEMPAGAGVERSSFLRQYSIMEEYCLKKEDLGSHE